MTEIVLGKIDSLLYKGYYVEVLHVSKDTYGDLATAFGSGGTIHGLIHRIENTLSISQVFYEGNKIMIVFNNFKFTGVLEFYNHGSWEVVLESI